MSRTQCPRCDSRRGLAQYPNGVWCHACQYFKPTKSLLPIKKKLGNSIYYTCNLDKIRLEWLNQYYLTERDTDHNEIFGDCNNPNLIHFQYKNQCGQILFSWIRNIDKKIKNKWLFFGDKDELYYLKKAQVTKQSKGALVLVEDVISALRVRKECDVVALGGTSAKSKLLVPLLLQYNEILIWLDGDEAGRRAAQKLRSEFKLLRPTRIIRTLKDPKCHTPTELKGILDDNRVILNERISR